MIAVLNSLLQRIILWLKYNISVQFIQYGYKDTLIRTLQYRNADSHTQNWQIFSFFF